MLGIDHNPSFVEILIALL